MVKKFNTFIINHKSILQIHKFWCLIILEFFWSFFWPPKWDRGCLLVPLLVLPVPLVMSSDEEEHSS